MDLKLVNFETFLLKVKFFKSSFYINYYFNISFHLKKNVETINS